MKNIVRNLLVALVVSVSFIAGAQETAPVTKRYDSIAEAIRASKGKHNVRFYACKTDSTKGMCLAGKAMGAEEAQNFFNELPANAAECKKRGLSLDLLKYCGGCYLVYEVRTEKPEGKAYRPPEPPEDRQVEVSPVYYGRLAPPEPQERVQLDYYAEVPEFVPPRRVYVEQRVAQPNYYFNEPVCRPVLAVTAPCPPRVVRTTFRPPPCPPTYGGGYVGGSYPTRPSTTIRNDIRSDNRNTNTNVINNSVRVQVPRPPTATRPSFGPTFARNVQTRDPAGPTRPSHARRR